MAERLDYRIYGTIQNELNNHTYWPGGKNNNLTQFSSNIDYYYLGCLVSFLDLRLSTCKEDEIKQADKLFDKKSGTLSRKFDDNSTESNIATINCEYNVLKRDFKMKRNSCAIHDGCINLLPCGNEEMCNKVKDREHADIKVGIRCGGCSNQETIKGLQSRFGKLLRIGSLGGDVWNTTTPSKTCHFVHAHSRYTKEDSSTIEHQRSMYQVPACEKKDGTASSCSDTLLVDKFEDISHIVTLFDLRILDSDPKELTYYITCIAEFYFDHIIIIGETNCGVIFLDCYSRVFLYDDENLLLWPLGDSLEEASRYTIKGKDRLGWFVKNGIVYEYIKEPQFKNSKTGIN